MSVVVVLVQSMVIRVGKKCQYNNPVMMSAEGQYSNHSENNMQADNNNNHDNDGNETKENGQQHQEQQEGHEKIELEQDKQQEMKERERRRRASNYPIKRYSMSQLEHDLQLDDGSTIEKLEINLVSQLRQHSPETNNFDTSLMPLHAQKANSLLAKLDQDDADSILTVSDSACKKQVNTPSSLNDDDDDNALDRDVLMIMSQCNLNVTTKAEHNGRHKDDVSPQSTDRTSTTLDDDDLRKCHSEAALASDEYDFLDDADLAQMSPIGIIHDRNSATKINQQHLAAHSDRSDDIVNPRDEQPYGSTAVLVSPGFDSSPTLENSTISLATLIDDVQPQKESLENKHGINGDTDIPDTIRQSKQYVETELDLLSTSSEQSTGKQSDDETNQKQEETEESDTNQPTINPTEIQMSQNETKEKKDKQQQTYVNRDYQEGAQKERQESTDEFGSLMCNLLPPIIEEDEHDRASSVASSIRGAYDSSGTNLRITGPAVATGEINHAPASQNSYYNSLGPNNLTQQQAKAQTESKDQLDQNQSYSSQTLPSNFVTDEQQRGHLIDQNTTYHTQRNINYRARPQDDDEIPPKVPVRRSSQQTSNNYNAHHQQRLPQQQQYQHQNCTFQFSNVSATSYAELMFLEQQQSKQQNNIINSENNIPVNKYCEQAQQQQQSECLPPPPSSTLATQHPNIVPRTTERETSRSLGCLAPTSESRSSNHVQRQHVDRMRYSECGRFETTRNYTSDKEKRSLSAVVTPTHSSLTTLMRGPRFKASAPKNIWSPSSSSIESSAVGPDITAEAAVDEALNRMQSILGVKNSSASVAMISRETTLAPAPEQFRGVQHPRRQHSMPSIGSRSGDQLERDDKNDESTTNDEQRTVLSTGDTPTSQRLAARRQEQRDISKFWTLPRAPPAEFDGEMDSFRHNSTRGHADEQANEITQAPKMGPADGSWYKSMFNAMHKPEDSSQAPNSRPNNEHNVIRVTLKSPRTDLRSSPTYLAPEDEDAGASRHKFYPNDISEYEPGLKSSIISQQARQTLYDELIRQVDLMFERTFPSETRLRLNSLGQGEKTTNQSSNSRIYGQRLANDTHAPNSDHMQRCAFGALTRNARRSVGYDSDSTTTFAGESIDERTMPPRQSNSNHREYVAVQRGQDVPLGGLRMTAPPPHSHRVRDKIHHPLSEESIQSWHDQVYRDFEEIYNTMTSDKVHRQISSAFSSYCTSQPEAGKYLSGAKQCSIRAMFSEPTLPASIDTGRQAIASNSVHKFSDQAINIHYRSPTGQLLPDDDDGEYRDERTEIIRRLLSGSLRHLRRQTPCSVSHQRATGVDLNRYSRSFWSTNASSSLKLTRAARVASVIRDFRATNDDELSLERGDLVLVVHIGPGGQARVEDCASGLVGLVPLAYLDTSIGCALVTRDFAGLAANGKPRLVTNVRRGEHLTLLRRLTSDNSAPTGAVDKNDNKSVWYECWRRPQEGTFVAPGTCLGVLKEPRTRSRSHDANLHCMNANDADSTVQPQSIKAQSLRRSKSASDRWNARYEYERDPESFDHSPSRHTVDAYISNQHHQQQLRQLTMKRMVERAASMLSGNKFGLDDDDADGEDAYSIDNEYRNSYRQHSRDEEWREFNSKPDKGDDRDSGTQSDASPAISTSVSVSDLGSEFDAPETESTLRHIMHNRTVRNTQIKHSEMYRCTAGCSPTTHTTGGSNTQHQITRQHQKHYPRLCRVKYAYKPQQCDELQLNVDDIVSISLECDDGWCIGTSSATGAIGTFPANFVEPCSL
ncbi:Sorbin and SH3 domain-containing protein 1-like protein, partial [Fragariocoptes setiger]